MVPGEGYATGRVLFTEDSAVPGEVHLFQDGLPVVCEALLRRAATEGIVGVLPARAVGGGAGNQPAFRVPGVMPGVRFAGETGLLAEGGAAELIVFVADAAGAGDVGADVGALAAG